MIYYFLYKMSKFTAVETQNPIEEIDNKCFVQLCVSFVFLKCYILSDGRKNLARVYLLYRFVKIA